MVRNIEAALGGAPQARLPQARLGNKTPGDTTPQSKKEPTKKLKSGGKVARVAEGIR
jgi:hypothetical protein